MNGTSCATLSCASWLSIVIADGVAMMLESVSLRTARMMAAKLKPLSTMRPTPRSAPLGSDAPLASAVVGFAAMLATSVSEIVPDEELPMGELKAPTGMFVPFELEYAAQLTPSAADLL